MFDDNVINSSYECQQWPESVNKQTFVIHMYIPGQDKLCFFRENTTTIITQSSHV